MWYGALARRWSILPGQSWRRPLRLSGGLETDRSGVGCLADIASHPQVEDWLMGMLVGGPVDVYARPG